MRFPALFHASHAPPRLVCSYMLRFFLVILCFGTGAPAQIALADSSPKHGDPAPVLSLTTIDGKNIDTSRLTGSVQVLLFGQSDHKRTTQAIEYIDHALDSTLLEGVRVEWILILSKSSDPSTLIQPLLNAVHKPLVVHDAQRKAFGAYEIIALPTAVIVDSKNRVVHALPSLSPRFGDIVADAILLAAEKIEPAQFEQTLHPKVVLKDHDRIRVDRIVSLARKAAERGMNDLARSQYTKALEIYPDSTPARLGLGHLLLRQGELDEAEKTFAALLKTSPSSPDGNLGLASVHAARGGDHLDMAESLVRKVLQDHPDHARAHFVLGLIYQQRSEYERAAESFKIAAEILLKAATPEP